MFLEEYCTHMELRRCGSFRDEIVVNFSCGDLAVVLDCEVGYGRNGSRGNFMPWRQCGA